MSEKMEVYPFTKEELKLLYKAVLAYGSLYLRHDKDFERIEELEALNGKVVARQMALWRDNEEAITNEEA